jgi:ParB family chromosome partitioning protein
VRSSAPAATVASTIPATRRSCVDERAEVRRAGPRVPHGELRGPGGEAVEVVVVDGLVHEVASGGHADLALVQEGAPGSGRGGGVQVGVVEDDQGVVAAEFEQRPLERATGGLADLPADGRRSGEGDRRDRGVRGQRRAGSGVAGQDVQDAVGQAGFLEEAGQEQAAGDGGARVRLEHDRVAEGERRGEGPQGQHHRDVPRRDHADDAEWHAARDRRAAGGGRLQHAVGLGGQRGGHPEFVEG